MITQYGTYGSISSDIQNLVANKISILDKYVLMQTGKYEYTALVYNPATKKTKQYSIKRNYTNSNNYYTVIESDSTFEYTIDNEYYVYSNVGYGKSLDLPVYDGMVSYSLTFIAVVLAFAIVFKGVLFKCLKRKKR